MKYFITILLLIIFVKECRPEEKRIDIDPMSRDLQGNQTVKHQSKIFINSGDGKLIIDLETGIVEFYNTNIDEASMAFWNHVMTEYPWIKRNIIREYFLNKKNIESRTR